MIDPCIVMFLIYFGSILLYMLEDIIQLFIKYCRDGRNQWTVQEETDQWEWLIELEKQPIEVTFDHETFLVYDRDIKRWNLEKREMEPPDDFDDLIELLMERQITKMIRFECKYVRTPRLGGIRSPSKIVFK